MTQKNLTKKQKDFRREVSRLNSMANKRIKRLANSKFNTSPAYKKWLESGGKYFSIRGKSQQEVWKEYYRVQQFLNYETSTITGSKKVLKNTNENFKLDLTYEELIERSGDLYRLSDKVQEVLTIQGKGALYDSDQRMKAVGVAVQDNDLNSLDDIDSLLGYVEDYLEDSYNNQVNSVEFDLGSFREIT